MKRNSITIPLNKTIQDQAIQWASTFSSVCILDSNKSQNLDYPKGTSYELIIGVGATDSVAANNNSFAALRAFHSLHKDWLFGHLSYDLKNEIEHLTSNNFDAHHTPNLHFFVPETVLCITNSQLEIHTHLPSAKDVLHQISTQTLPTAPLHASITLQPRIHHADYIRGVKSMLHHIQMGDIYEANFCQEFYSENVEVRPFELYQTLTDTSPTPFSAYYHFENHFVLCASPERYLQKKNTHLLSQPIKGTAKRGANPQDDQRFKNNLRNSLKDQTENVMIVDLVRNDLSRIAQQESVNVTELFGVYSFSNVHQMISTIEARLHDQKDFVDALQETFPMGSMTGAPKIMAMKLIEEFESTKRGLYSGAIGYVSPSGDFDFNVVIRSLQYNSANKYLSYMVGGAITQNSDPEEEFQECLIKAESIRKVLSGEY